MTLVTDRSEQAARDYAQELATREGAPAAVYRSGPEAHPVWWVRPEKAPRPEGLGVTLVAIVEPLAKG